MSNYLILWNNSSFAVMLAGWFGKKNIITCSEDLKTHHDKINSYDTLIVLCELNWSTDNTQIKLHELKGVELIKYLRLDFDLITPVLFVSFLPLTYILNSEREIITAIGHDFLQLPTTPNAIQSIIKNSFVEKDTFRKLSEMELMDVKSFYCSREGILSHALHQLNSFLNITITIQNHDSIYFDLIKTIRRIHELFMISAANAEINFKSEYTFLTSGTVNSAVNYIKHIGTELLEKFGKNTENTGGLPEKRNQNRWKVLLLDDEIDEQHELIKTMHSKSIDVICVKNAIDANMILSEDVGTTNRIMVVIADYRLYEIVKGTKRHQKIQGYQFLKDLTLSDHLVRIVAFSGLERKFLFNTFKHFNIRTEIKSKTDYLSSEQTRQIFCDEIIEIGEENLETIEEMPSKCAGFKNHLERAYRLFRLHPDYYKMENNISLTATQYVTEIQKQINDSVEIRIGEIENIKTPLKKKYKDLEAHFKRLSNYFVARRIALWLYAANKKGKIANIDSRRIAEILTDQSYPTDAYRQIISTNLGLSLDDFPKNITIEERRWLQYDMQMNIFRDINLIIPVFNQIEKFFKKFISEHDELSSELKNNNFILIDHYKKNKDYFVIFKDDFTPTIKTSTDIRFVFRWIVKTFKTDLEKLELIKPLISQIRLALFESHKNVYYLRNLFEYFNALYRILNHEQTLFKNIKSKIKDKTSFEDKSEESFQKIFAIVYEMLLNKQIPDQKLHSADVFLVYVIGEVVIDKFKDKNKDKDTDKEITRAEFYSEMTKEINQLYTRSRYYFDENIKSKKKKPKIIEDDDNDDLQDLDF